MKSAVLVRGGWAVLCGGLLAAFAYGQDGKLPKAEELLDNYVKVTGGKDAYEKCRSQVVTGTFEFSGQKGALTTYSAVPNLTYTVIDIENLGKIEEGVDGRHAWSNDPISGARVKEGVEKDMALRMATFNAALHWRKAYKKAETVGMESIGGREHYKVRLTPETGSAVTVWFDKQSGLQARMAVTMEVNGQETPVEADFSDHRKVGELTFPHKVVQRFMGVEQLITIAKVELNVEIPKERFDPPAEVKKLLEGK